MFSFCYRKHESIALYLIEKGANVHILNHQNRGALHTAAYNGTVMALKVLIQKGCNPNEVVSADLWSISVSFSIFLWFLLFICLHYDLWRFSTLIVLYIGRVQPIINRNSVISFLNVRSLLLWHKIRFVNIVCTH